MLRKLNLVGADEYAVSIVTNYVAEMVVKFGLGQQHSISIGSEQGDIAAWDDIVIQELDFQKHVQIKRQNTNFSDENCNKTPIIKKDSTVKLRDLSVLDETLKSLADWTKINNQTALALPKIFEIVLPTATINIKKDLPVNVLKNLCETYIKDVTTVTGLKDLQANDTTIDRCYKWLNTWCDFENWEHILKSLKLLKISANKGSKEDVDSNTKHILSQLYNNTDDVFIKLKDYVTNNSTFTGAITPRPLFNLLKNYLLPSVQQWTQFEKKTTNWELSGTHDSISAEEIERPSILVPALWDKTTSSALKIVVPDNIESVLLNKILHLAFHMEGLSNSHILDHNVWKQTMSKKIGDTLGIDKNDCQNLSILNNNTPFSAADIKLYDSLQKQDELATKIDNEIIKATWRSVCNSINKTLTEMTSSELRNSMEERWKAWCNDLENDIVEQKNIFKIMLHPDAEGEGVEGDLRIGAKTVDLIADGISLLLVVSVALSKDHNTWKKISDNYSATTIGLSYWSGPSNKKRKVQNLDDEGIKDLIGQVSSDILVLSKVTSNESEIFDANLASGKSLENSLAESHRPKLIITNHKKIRELIAAGKINPLKTHLEEIIQRNEDSKNNSINKATS